MDTLAPFRTYFRYAAMACSLASAILTGIFAWNQGEWWLISMACVLFLVACSLCSDYINLFVVEAWRARRWGMVAVFGAGAAFVFTLNLISNIGSVGWQRDTLIKAATVQNTRYDDARDQVVEGKASLEMWKARLAKLEAENAWSSTVTADALRARLDSAQLAIDQEAKRGGCGPRCLERTKERDDLQARIAIAEETGTLRKQIEATKAILAKHRAKSENTETKVAAPASQAKFFASMATISLTPTDTATTWTDRGIASWIALGLCIAPILFGLIGWKSDDPPVSQSGSRTETPSPSGQIGAYPLHIPSEPLHVHTVETIKDETLAQWASSPMVQELLGRNQLRAA